MSKSQIILLFTVLTAVLLSSCKEKSVPRPYGYFRVDLPENTYRKFHNYGYPYSFEFNDIAEIYEREEQGESYWIDLTYPGLNANIYCSYKPVHSDLFDLLEESRRIVYKHSVRADAISERPYENRESGVFGILYELSGNVASPVQFVLTDSSRHFFRAALYFENTPNSDSIAPVLSYISEDIIKLVESFEWKNQ